jgi:UDP:flavonoid glycosyltransferase YjiC (YdhE family)
MDLNKLRYNRGLPLYRSQGEIFDNALMIANTAFGFEYPLPVSPLTKLTGPLMPSVKPPIPPSLASWLDKSSKPVVLVLFGFGCMSYLEGWQVRQLYNGLNESKFRVLWALRPEEKVLLQKVGDVQFPATTFRIKSNFPQLGVIAHTSVRVVVSPCGMATAQESLYYGKTL